MDGWIDSTAGGSGERLTLTAKASPAAARSAAALDRWRRAQSSLVKTKSTKKALTEKAITVVTMFMPMPPAPPFESPIAPASQNRRGRPSAQQRSKPRSFMLFFAAAGLTLSLAPLLRAYLDWTAGRRTSISSLGVACRRLQGRRAIHSASRPAVPG